MSLLCCFFMLLNVNPQSKNLPVVTVTTDDTVITQSCRVRIPAGTVIADGNRDGVIQVKASDIEITFEDGSVLRGSAMNADPDTYEGFGIRIKEYKNVAIRNARVSGFRCGVYATKADGLTLDGADASDNFRQHLRSMPWAEDGGDWLWPHQNDNHEWLDNYGAGFYVEDTEGFTVRNCRIRHGQNALLLCGADGGEVYDNDFSFNSGWGIGMWRASRNVISRNAIDFCIRGYSHGVYNRGQDSAGILMFEQCCENVLVENSVTHGGDGFFGFAGREALGEGGATHPDEWYKERGCNDNVLTRNDFSYAAAHGIEMTFSFRNKYVENRLVGNAICGVWGGYSCETLVMKNEIANNGEAGYGLERGGINIEHGRGNKFVGNAFSGNKCGVHLWFDPDDDFQKKPWGRVNGTASTDNLIAGNKFVSDKLAFHFRGSSDVTLGENEFKDVGEVVQVEGEVTVDKLESNPEMPAAPKYRVLGKTNPVGARKALYGRKNIIMTEWGPWDHESPYARLVVDDGMQLAYELWNWPDDVNIECTGDAVSCSIEKPGKAGTPAIAKITSAASGVHPFRARIHGGTLEQKLNGTLIGATWDVAFFAYPKEKDPRENSDEWRKWASEQRDNVVQASRIKFAFGHGGPSDIDVPSTDEAGKKVLRAAKLGGNHFGLVAKSTLPLTAGKWRLTTMSDDGLRITVDGKPVIDNWTWHAPTRDEGVFELPADKAVEIVVEYFELDGYAVLELGISKAE